MLETTNKAFALRDLNATMEDRARVSGLARWQCSLALMQLFSPGVPPPEPASHLVRLLHLVSTETPARAASSSRGRARSSSRRWTRESTLQRFLVPQVLAGRSCRGELS